MASARSVPTHGPPPWSHRFVGSGGGGYVVPSTTPPPRSKATAPAHTSKTNLRIPTPSSYRAGRQRPAAAKQRGAAYQCGHGRRIGHAATLENPLQAKFGESPFH